MKRRKPLISHGNQLPSFSELLESFTPSDDRSRSTGSLASLKSPVSTPYESTSDDRSRLLDKIDYEGMNFEFQFPGKSQVFEELRRQGECADKSWTQLQNFHTRWTTRDIQGILKRATSSNEILEPLSQSYSTEELKNIINSMNNITSLAERLINHKLSSPKRRRKNEIVHGVEKILNLDIDYTARNVGHGPEMSLGGLNHQFPVAKPVMECQHCSSSRTPEWRRGPNGSRTLCNACGLYYSKLVKRYGRAVADTEMRDKFQSGDVLDRKL